MLSQAQVARPPRIEAMFFKSGYIRVFLLHPARDRLALRIANQLAEFNRVSLGEGVFIFVASELVINLAA